MTTQPKNPEAQTISLDRRVGMIHIDDHLLRRSQEISMLVALFSRCVVLDIQRNWLTQVSTYVIWHESLRALDEGEMIPFYRAVITKHNDGLACVTFQENHTGSPIAFGAAEVDAAGREGGAA